MARPIIPFLLLVLLLVLSCKDEKQSSVIATSPNASSTVLSGTNSKSLAIDPQSIDPGVNLKDTIYAKDYLIKDLSLLEQPGYGYLCVTIQNTGEEPVKTYYHFPEVWSGVIVFEDGMIGYYLSKE